MPIAEMDLNGIKWQIHISLYALVFQFTDLFGLVQNGLPPDSKPMVLGSAKMGSDMLSPVP